jgi:hypothetical protein
LLSDPALQTASAALLGYLPGTVPPAAMASIEATSLYLDQEDEETIEDLVMNSDPVAKLKYDWIDSRKAKILQLATVWKMWNQVSRAYFSFVFVPTLTICGYPECSQYTVRYPGKSYHARGYP